MNAPSLYQWPTGFLARPSGVDHAHWTGTPYQVETPKLTDNTKHVPPIGPYLTPGWIATPLPPPQSLPSFIVPAYQPPYYPMPTPAPAVNEIPPLISDFAYEDDDDDAPVRVQHHPWNLPPPPPFGYLATPVQTPHAFPTNNMSSDDLLHLAKIRALNESSIPLIRVTVKRVKGRPAHWRPGYKPTTCTRIKSCLAKSVCTSSIHTLHPLMSYKFPRNYPIMLDLRHSYMTAVFHNPERYLNVVDLFQLATTPPVPTLQLYHPLLPWYVDIQAGSTSGVTIYDILTQLCTSLQMPIADIDFRNDVLSSDDRERFTDAYNLRNSGSPEGLAKGISKVDFLGPNVLFRGLTRRREGWLIKTTSLY